jgi:hypothetical protein
MAFDSADSGKAMVGVTVKVNQIKGAVCNIAVQLQGMTVGEGISYDEQVWMKMVIIDSSNVAGGFYYLCHQILWHPKHMSYLGKASASAVFALRGLQLFVLILS